MISRDIADTEFDELLDIDSGDDDTPLDENLSPELARLVNTDVCWASPCCRAVVYVFSGFNILLLAFIFFSSVISWMLLSALTWYFLDQPALAILVLLLGMELEQTPLWKKSRKFRRAAAICVGIMFFMAFVVLFLPYRPPYKSLFTIVGMFYISYLTIGTFALGCVLYILLYVWNVNINSK